MYSTPDKSAQTIRFLIAILGIVLAVIGWVRFID